MTTSTSVEAYIHKVDEYAVHDGPGGRALVFLKGCSLRCKWCQNPELLKPEPEVVVMHGQRCVLCRQCEKACPVDAINLEKEDRIDRGKCLGFSCNKCVEVCPYGVYEVIGSKMTPEELYQQLAKYKIFYNNSNGGVTLTGGDPLFYPEFSAEVLRLCQEDHIHTAIETALYAPYETLWKVVQYCDCTLCDIKHMDSKKHKEGTGVPNELILDNLKKLNQDFKGDIVVRIPLIPGFNDDEENVARTAEFLCSLRQVKGIDLLPFNELPVAKYDCLGERWVYSGTKSQSREYLEKLKGIVDFYNGRFRCTIGGLW